MRLVFVSSTFKDMQFERDLLNIRVVPRIDSFLSSYGESVHFGDLRWGVNTSELDSEESSKKVLKVCLDEIDDCRPYMIVFIGERYGWIPSSSLLENAMKLKGINNVPKDISVTNLEIEYGALLNPDFSGKILFYFRNPIDTSEMSEEERKIYEVESPLHKEKLDSLKKKILETYPNQVRYYDAKYDKETHSLVGLESLMDNIVNDLEKAFKIDLDYYQTLPPHVRAIMNSETYFKKYYENAYPRSDSEVTKFNENYEKYYDARFNNLPLCELIAGEEGSGRKTLLALKYQNAKNEGLNVIPFAFGKDEYTNTVNRLISTLCGHFEEYLVKEMEIDVKEKADIDYLAELIRNIDFLNKEKFFVFIMNANQDVLGALRNLEMKLPKTHSISFIVEMDKYEQTPIPFYKRNHIIHLSELKEEEKIGVISAIVNSKHKELSKSIIDEIIKKKASNNPLYLSLLVERLLMLDHEDFQKIRGLGDDMNAINAYMINLVKESGDDIKSIAKSLLKEAVERINKKMILKIIAILTHQHHLNQLAIEGLFKYKGWDYNELDFSLFKRYVQSLFTVNSQSESILWFKNDEIVNAAKELIQDYKEDNHADDIIDWLKNDDSEDEEVRLEMLLFFYHICGRPKDYIDLLIDSSEQVDRNNQAIVHTLTRYFSQPLILSYFQEDSFALDVCDELINRLINNEIKNYYQVVDCYILYFLVPVMGRKDKARLACHFLDVATRFIRSSKAHPDNKPLFEFAMIVSNAPTTSIVEVSILEGDFISKYEEVVAFGQENNAPSFMTDLATKGKVAAVTQFGLSLHSGLYSLYQSLQEIDDEDEKAYYYQTGVEAIKQIIAQFEEVYTAEITFYLAGEPGLIGETMLSSFNSISILVIIGAVFTHELFIEGEDEYYHAVEAFIRYSLENNLIDDKKIFGMNDMFIKLCKVFFDYINIKDKYSDEEQENLNKTYNLIMDKLGEIIANYPNYSEAVHLYSKYLSFIRTLNIKRNDFLDFYYVFDNVLYVCENDKDYDSITNNLVPLLTIYRVLQTKEELDDTFIKILKVYMDIISHDITFEENELLPCFSYRILDYLSLLKRDTLNDPIIDRAFNEVYSIYYKNEKLIKNARELYNSHQKDYMGSDSEDELA